MLLRLILVCALCTLDYRTEAASLGTVTDDDLLQYIKTEQYVVALFSKKDCEICDNYENELINLRDDLVDSLSAWVVKVVDSQMLRLYSSSKEPALVFFRNGIPLLYDGPLNDEEILNTFLENKDPIVKELTDDNFEHLTQASSGATTGDWFVMLMQRSSPVAKNFQRLDRFKISLKKLKTLLNSDPQVDLDFSVLRAKQSYSTDCVDCQRMGARWEAVGAKLKQRINVARVNKYTTGASTARRFNVFDVPEFILFRQGKMYRYQIPKYDVSAFVSFAKDWWKNAHGEKVPVPQSPFDDLTQMCANFLRENPWVMKLGSITIGVLVIVSVASKLRRKAEAPLKKD